jgi:hypothetical protein
VFGSTRTVTSRLPLERIAPASHVVSCTGTFCP